MRLLGARTAKGKTTDVNISSMCSSFCVTAGRCYQRLLAASAVRTKLSTFDIIHLTTGSTSCLRTNVIATAARMLSSLGAPPLLMFCSGRGCCHGYGGVEARFTWTVKRWRACLSTGSMPVLVRSWMGRGRRSEAQLNELVQSCKTRWNRDLCSDHH